MLHACGCDTAKLWFLSAESAVQCMGAAAQLHLTMSGQWQFMTDQSASMCIHSPQHLSLCSYCTSALTLALPMQCRRSCTPVLCSPCRVSTFSGLVTIARAACTLDRLSILQSAVDLQIEYFITVCEARARLGVVLQLIADSAALIPVVLCRRLKCPTSRKHSSML